MQRYTLIPYQKASGAVKEMYDDFLRTTGSPMVPIWVQSLGANENLLHAYWERAKGSLAKGDLPGVLKEMVVFTVSYYNGARYCSAAHAHAVLTMDPSLQFDDLTKLVDSDDDSLDIPPAYKTAIRFAAKTVKDPNGVTDADFEALEDADFSPEEISELLSVIDLGMMFNSYTSALKLPIDPEYRPVLEPLA